jgi:hypothetical protein
MRYNTTGGRLPVLGMCLGDSGQIPPDQHDRLDRDRDRSLLNNTKLIATTTTRNVTVMDCHGLSPAELG